MSYAFTPRTVADYPWLQADTERQKNRKWREITSPGHEGKLIEIYCAEHEDTNVVDASIYLRVQAQQIDPADGSIVMMSNKKVQTLEERPGRTLASFPIGDPSAKPQWVAKVIDDATTACVNLSIQFEDFGFLNS